MVYFGIRFEIDKEEEEKINRTRIILKTINMKMIMSLLFVAFATFSFGQTTKKVQTIKFDTSAECGSCKKRIEDKLNYVSGVKFAELDVPSKVLTVKFKTSKNQEV